MATAIDKDLVWLPKELADKVKDWEKSEKGVFPKEYEDAILGYLDKSKIDMKTELDAMKEEAVMYRGLLIETRREFEKVCKDELEASYTVWEKFDTDRKHPQRYVNKIIEGIEPLREGLKEIKEFMKTINTFELEKLLSLVKELNSIMHYSEGNTGNMLKFLMDNYKK